MMSLFSGFANFYSQGVMSRISVENFTNHKIRNHFVEERFCAVFQKSSGSEKVFR